LGNPGPRALENHLSAVYWTSEPQASAGEGCPPILTPECIEISLVSPELVTDDDILREFASVLGEDEAARWRRFVFPADRHDFLVSHALVRFALSRHVDVHPAEWRFATNRFGRPEIASPAAGHGLRFSLSHTEGLIAVAVTRRRDVGIDVENATRNLAVGVVESVLTENEVRAACRLPDEQKRERFFALWTLKEAYAKARGMGVSLNFREISFDLDARPPIKVSVRSNADNDAERWHCELRRPTEGHFLAVVHDASQFGRAQVRIVPLVPRIDR
jgi:4'-phosphopantetheinyl transferase